MPTYTGTELARAALRELGVLDPTEAGDNAILSDALAVGTDLLDEWRTENLLIRGVTRTQYSLTNGTQAYTIGNGAPVFNTDLPTDIPAWSVVPDRTAAQPVELPQGQLTTYDEWQNIRVKSQTGSYPVHLYWDKNWAAGLSNLYVHPIPNVAIAAVVLYMLVPSIVSLIAATQYNLAPGYASAIKTNLALELGSGRFARARGIPPGLAQRALRSKANIKRLNMRPLEAPLRSEFIIGGESGRRTFNVYEGSS